MTAAPLASHGPVARVVRLIAASVRWSTIGLALVLAILVGVLAIAQYWRYDPAADTRTTVNFASHPIAIVLHAIGASFAPLLGLLQCSTRLRRRWPALHHWLGRAYLVGGVAIGGTAALWLSFFGYGGPVARTGLSAAAVVWLGTSAVAFVMIRAGDVAAHRRWMLRSVALALGGVTLRIYLPLFAVADVPFLIAYRAVAWGSWVPNLLIAELFLRWERRRVGVPRRRD